MKTTTENKKEGHPKVTFFFKPDLHPETYSDDGNKS